MSIISQLSGLFRKSSCKASRTVPDTGGSSGFRIYTNIIFKSRSVDLVPVDMSPEQKD